MISPRTRCNHLWLPLVLVLVMACGGGLDRTKAQDPTSVIDSEGASWILVTPPLDDVRVAALQILVNVEGLLGVIDLLRESYDVDLGDEDVLEGLGLDPRLPLVVLGVDEGTCLAMGAETGAPLEEVIRRVGETSGYRVEHRLSEQGRLTRVYDKDRCIVALLHDEGLALLGYDPLGRADGAVARVALHHLQTESPGVQAPEGRFLLEWRRGMAEERADVSGWPGPLAGVGHWLHNAKSSIQSLRISAAVNIDGIKWDLEIESSGPAAPLPPAQRPASMDWKDAVPEDAVLLLQVKGSIEDTLADLLGGKGMYILGLLAGEILDKKHIPTIRQTIGSMGSEVGFALLGADPRASVKEIVAPSSVLQALNSVHMGVVVRGAPPAKILELIPVEDGPVAGGWRARVVSADSPHAVEICKTKDERALCLGVVAADDRLMVLSGKGETDRVARVWSGAAPAMGGALFVERDSGDVIVTVKMKRLVRDMRSKGVPPFYLRMANSFLEIQAVRRDDTTLTRVEGEVLLR